MTMIVTGVGRLSHPAVLVIGRTVSVVESVATVVAAAWMARLATPDRRAMWLTPLLVAILPVSVGFAYYMTPDPAVGPDLDPGGLRGALGVPAPVVGDLRVRRCDGRPGRVIQVQLRDRGDLAGGRPPVLRRAQPLAAAAWWRPGAPSRRS